MSKINMLLVLLFISVFAAFAFHNNDTTSITVPFDKAYDVPKIWVMLTSSLMGALFILVIFMVRDTRKFVMTYQYQRRQKRDQKVDSLYSRAVNSLIGDNLADARAALDEILRVEPQHTDALLRLGNLEELQEKNEEAVGAYKKALMSMNDNFEALFSLIGVLVKIGNREDALKYADKILDIDPDNHGALFRKRSLLEADGGWDEILEVQKTILKLESDEERKKDELEAMIGYRYELARDSLEKGNIEKANTGFRSILREDEKFIPAYLGIAEVMLSEGNSEDAVNFLEKAYEATGSQIVLARIEDLLISEGEPSRLIRLYRKAILDRPQDEKPKFFLAKLFFRLEMVDDSFEILSSMDIGEGPSYVEVHKLLGELYMRRNQCEKAVELFKKTLEIKSALRVPYCCGECGHSEVEWSGRCPECGSWNTYDLDLHGTCKA
jgi:tetratricopeptide (TPR) repeat protein